MDIFTLKEIVRYQAMKKCMKQLSNVEIHILSVQVHCINDLFKTSLPSQVCPNFSRNALLLTLFMRASVVLPGENFNFGSLSITVHKFPYFSIPLLMY